MSKKGIEAQIIVWIIIGLLVLFIVLYLISMANKGSFEIIDLIKEAFT